MQTMIAVPRELSAQAHKVRSTVARITPTLSFATTATALGNAVHDIDDAIAELRRLRFSVRALEFGQ
jgi:hypothetical protein